MWYLKLMLQDIKKSLSRRRYEEMPYQQFILYLSMLEPSWSFVNHLVQTTVRRDAEWNRLMVGSNLAVFVKLSHKRRWLYLIDNSCNYMLVSTSWPSFPWFMQKVTTKANLWQLFLKHNSGGVLELFKSKHFCFCCHKYLCKHLYICTFSFLFISPTVCQH